MSKQLIRKPMFSKSYTYNFWSGPVDIKLIKYLKKNHYDFVVIDKWVGEKILNQFLSLAQFYDIPATRIINIVEFYEKTTFCCPMVHAEISDEEIISMVEKPSNKLLSIKRFMDLLIATLTLPIVLPIIFIAAVLTKLTSKGPSIFSQQRVGKNGKLFTLYKIRTMIYSPEGYQVHTVRGDKRITKLGKLFRKTKIDELPQLWNVLKGDMSLIGPRPERVDIVDKFAIENNFYPLRHIIKPGITGWAQVNNPTATPEENLEKLEYDLYYINHLSVKLELQILLRTVGVVSSMESL
ncbi:sugar transferase [Parasediminibacterium sp. JCM 36343]|uniref:sugar transferase n=1 Tax=Parasediminibacterium sp. JCM 36343 TaxID=3374279 RepID=UPI003979FE5F